MKPDNVLNLCDTDLSFESDFKEILNSERLWTFSSTNFFAEEMINERDKYNFILYMTKWNLPPEMTYAVHEV